MNSYHLAKWEGKEKRGKVFTHLCTCPKSPHPWDGRKSGLWAVR